MTARLWRWQLTLVWVVGLATAVFTISLGFGGNGLGIESVYQPLPEGVSMRGTLASPFAWLTFAAAAAAWLAPFAAVYLAWRGRRALRDGGQEPRLHDRLVYGTIAAYVIAASYLTPVGWTLVWGLTRVSIQHIWGEGPEAHNL